MSEKSASTVPALDKAVRILDLLAREATPLSGAEIAKLLDLPRSSVHGLIGSLLAAGLLRKADERHFVLGAHVMYWANGCLAQQDIVAEFHEAIARLPELDPYTLTLSTLSNDQVVYLACRNSQSPLGFTFRIGMQLPAVFTATGKMMLSALSAAEVQALLPQFPPPYTERSVQSHTELADELAGCRRQGYALDDGQLRRGMHCFGTAVFDHAGQARFGVAASLIEAEADEKTRQHLVDGLKKLAAQLTRTLGGQLPA